MNKLCCLIAMTIASGFCQGQNLVPNGDFEQFSPCPNSVGQLTNALFWVNPTLQGSPDYFNQCASGLANAPNATWGYQPAHSGDGYCGIDVRDMSVINGREYIEVPLTGTLSANVCYHFQMYVSLANNSTITTDDIGVYFSDLLVINFPGGYLLPFTAQINNQGGFITDTLSWVSISGNYTAIGGENYILIGNFKNDVNTDTLTVNTGSANYALFYIDDVSLTPCTTGMNDQTGNAEIKVYPNPINDRLNIASENNELYEFFLYDIASRKILQQKFTNSISFNTEQLAKGVYYYELRNLNGVIKKGKVVKD